MIPADVVIGTIETPWQREAGDECARETLGLVGFKNRGTDAIQIQLVPGQVLNVFVLGLPFVPELHKQRLSRVELLQDAGASLLCGLRRVGAAGQRYGEVTALLLPVDLAGEGDISLVRQVGVRQRFELGESRTSI